MSEQSEEERGTDPVTLRIAEHAAIVSLNAPPLNIFNLDMRDALIEALNAVASLEHISAMILRSDGAHFSAGADLSEFGQADSIHEARRIRWDRDPWGPLWDMPVPTIASVQGVAVGSGMEMAMLCDVRIAGPTASIGLPETKLGMLPAAGGTQSLTKAIGPDQAVPIVALGLAMDATEALQRGVVSAVTEDPDQEALAIAERLASFDRQALITLKRAMRASLDQPLRAGLETERRLAELLAGR